MEQEIQTILDTPAKRLMREKIKEMWTNELKHQCKGLAVIVLSLEERQIVLNALKEVAGRKRREAKQKPLTLNIIRDPPLLPL